jgi:hypothetical protein
MLIALRELGPSLGAKIKQNSAIVPGGQNVPVSLPKDPPFAIL